MKSPWISLLAIAMAGCAQPNTDGGAADDPAVVEVARQAATSASTQNVKVVNAATEPLPTVVQGTTNVAGTVAAQQSGGWSVSQSGAWSVGAQQSGPWSVSLTGTPTVALTAGTSVAVSGGVNVTNTPTVNVGNTPTVNVGNTVAVGGVVALQAGTQVAIAGNPTVTVAGTPSVQGTNPASSPVAVRNGDAPGHQPFQHTSFLYWSDGDFSTTQPESLAVPQNKRLVIEYASAFFNLAPGGVPYGTVMGVLGAQGTSVTLWPTRMGAIGANDEWAVNGPFRVYGDGGTNLTVGCGRSSGVGFGNCSVTVVGYLIDL